MSRGIDDASLYRLDRRSGTLRSDYLPERGEIDELPHPSSDRHRRPDTGRRTRAWGLTQLVGIDLTVSGPDGPTTVGPTSVAVVALFAAIGAWLVLLFDRFGRHPRGWWAFVGSTTLAISGLGPPYRSDGLSALALMLLHFVTAIVVILGFAGTLPVYRPGPPTVARWRGTPRTSTMKA